MGVRTAAAGSFHCSAGRRRWSSALPMTARSPGAAPGRMHRAGAEIALTYLNDKARPHVEPLARAVDAALLLPLEIRDAAQVEALFEAVAARWGRLDILVHSIAFAPLRGAYRPGHRLSARRLSDRHGRLVLVAARSHAPGRETHVVGRHDLDDELSRRQRGHRELRDHGPGQGGARSGRALSGGRAWTHGHSRARPQPGPLATRAASGIPDFDALMQQVVERAPARRLVTIEEVGAALVFLASPYAAAMTGDTICPYRRRLSHPRLKGSLA